MSTIAGPRAIPTTQEGRLRELFERVNDYKSRCGCGSGLVTYGGAIGGGKTAAAEAPPAPPEPPCKACDGKGWVNRLAVVVDAMQTAGATPEDLLEWLGPLVEPEKQPGVIRYGGRVNIELDRQGPTMYGEVVEMTIERHMGDIARFERGRMEVRLVIAEAGRGPDLREVEVTSFGDDTRRFMPIVAERRSMEAERLVCSCDNTSRIFCDVHTDPLEFDDDAYSDWDEGEEGDTDG